MTYTRYNTCRLCKSVEFDGSLIHYAVRSYVHLACALDKWGEAFLDKIPASQLGSLPYGPLRDHGLLDKVLERFARLKGEDNV